MAATGPGNVVARHVTDDLITFSGETANFKQDQDEVHDSLLAAKDVKRGEESKLLALHEVIAEALEEIESQGNNVEMLDDEHNDGVKNEKLCPYGDRVLEMTKLCYVCDCYTDHELFSLMQECVVLEMYDLVYGWQINSCRIWYVPLALLGETSDVLKSLEYLSEMVERDSARVGVLKQLLVGAHVGMRLKAEYAADMGEIV
nr:hypothetical protein [Tanacetum cinerariifolium]